MINHQKLILAGKEFNSRLLVGTGKYKSFELMQSALIESGSEIITLAVKRVSLVKSHQDEKNILDFIPKHMVLLPNTAGCYTAEEAIRTARLTREAGVSDWVKLEVIGDPKTLLPDNEETLKAAKVLIDEGFKVFPYVSDDLIVAKKLEQMGCVAVMPLAAPIGSGLGVQNSYNIQLIAQTIQIPVIVDAGVGTASDAAIVMELGAAAILMNTAIAEAGDPIKMAQAMKLSTEAGRLAYEAERMPKRSFASASSPQFNLNSEIKK